LIAFRLWDRYGWKAVGIIVAVGLLVEVVLSLRRRWRGNQGLDQWPNPHGRHYREWMKRPEGDGDYYEWLSNKIGKP
jgi:hypothetical protein